MCTCVVVRRCLVSPYSPHGSPQLYQNTQSCNDFSCVSNLHGQHQPWPQKLFTLEHWDMHLCGAVLTQNSLSPRSLSFAAWSIAILLSHVSFHMAFCIFLILHRTQSKRSRDTRVLLCACTQIYRQAGIPGAIWPISFSGLFLVLFSFLRIWNVARQIM